MKQMIPLMDLKAQYLSIKEEIDASISETLENTSFIGGMPVAQFEKDFLSLVAPGYVVSCANGTDSMEMLLQALQISTDDEVIVPAHTWISTSEVVIRSGATPIFVDVDYDTCCLDIKDVQKKITPKTKAIIAVHLYGYPAPVQEINALIQDKDIVLIEDCAQAHGTQIQGQNIGTFGLAASYSFFPGKNLGCYGDGGGVYTTDKNLAETVRMIANHGQKSKHHHLLHGRNSRMDALQAKILSVKIPHLEKWIQQKNKHATFYTKALKDISEITLPPIVDNGNTHSWHLYVIKLKERDALLKFLKEEGIACGIHYPKAIPFQPCYQDRGFTEEDFPITARLQNEVLSLPMYAELTQDQCAYIVSKIKAFFKK